MATLTDHRFYHRVNARRRNEMIAPTDEDS